jgi:type II secretory pathway pseudopilin PulG
MESRSTSQRRGESGFTVVEGLIAAAILLLIAIGLLPLFARSILNNARGNDYLQASTHAASGLENLQRLPFNNFDIRLNTGAADLARSTYTKRSFGSGVPVSDQDWKTGAPPVGTTLWVRNIEVKQFGIHALDDGVITDDEALPGGTDPIFIQLKQIEVELDSGKTSTGGPIEGINPVRFRLLKTF